uniref:CapK n=1 Tax=Capnodium sp. TTI-000886 TaxID=3078996 RepID=A0AA96S2D8_9PEZI|nr:CapK [Capnodium sp. TTI-000886]
MSACVATSDLESLTQNLVQNAQALNQYYSKNAYPAPSFASDAPFAAIPESAPIEVKIARDAAMDHALKIFDLLSGPSKVLSNLTVSYQAVACLRWLCYFNVLKNVPLEGSISYADLAEEANVSEDSLKPIARMAMTSRFLCEPTPEHVSHTAASIMLAKSKPLHDWALFMGKEAILIALDMVEATEKWPKSTGTNQTPFNIAMETDLSFFDHLQQRPDHMRMYADYQKAVASTEGLDLRHVVQGYAWAGLGKATVVDVGGSVGLASVALAEAFPDLNFIVQELPDVIPGGQEYLATVKNDTVKSRIQYKAQDFFQDQAETGADVYLLRMILHYWSFDDSVQIIKKLVPALKPGHSRILVMDTTMPRPGAVSTVTERQLRVRDLAMMQLHGSHERTPEDWNAIFKAADPRLQLKGIYMPFGSELSLMELVLDK